MNSQKKIQSLLQQCCDELLAYIKEREPLYEDRWVPTGEIKKNLQLDVPAALRGDDQRGWLFAAFARMLQDQGRLEYRSERNQAFCRSVDK